MADITISDVNIFQGERGFIKGSLYISGDRIRAVVPASEEKSECSAQGITLPGRYVLPGLVDIHTHGNSGSDFSDGSREGLHEMGKYLAAHGITSFAPTSMTLPYEKLKTVFRTAAEYMHDRPDDGARVAGIHMEGPFSPKRRKVPKTESI